MRVESNQNINTQIQNNDEVVNSNNENFRELINSSNTVQNQPCNSNEVMECIHNTINSINNNEQFVNRVIREASQGKDFSQDELIAVQTGVYRYNQQIELISRIVDKATNGIKQIMNSGK